MPSLHLASISATADLREQPQIGFFDLIVAGVEVDGVHQRVAITGFRAPNSGELGPVPSESNGFGGGPVALILYVDRSWVDLVAGDELAPGNHEGLRRPSD